MRRLFLVSCALIATLSPFSPAAAQEETPGRRKAARSVDEFVKQADGKPAAEHKIVLDQPLDQKISTEERLEAKVSFHADGAMLRDFPASLEKVLNTSVVLVAKKLEEASINGDTPLSYHFKNVTVRTGLRLILREAGLTYVICDNVIQITTPEDASAHPVTRVYDCRDLLKVPTAVKRNPIAWHPSQGLGGAPAITQPGDPSSQAEKTASPEVGTPKKTPPKSVILDRDYTIDDLIEIITSNVHPDSWDFNGPEHLLDFKGLVVVTQTEEVHEDIEKLLNMLHKAAGLEEKVKVSR